ncbi:MAG: DUF3459 domain-containing protein [Streptosporangiales bacterium]|nr:DUF3459 domain-containing protein [Streptosporangiales bacterium]
MPALAADLDRIADLGYDVLQIMPRQPYPSYNVHDYTDVSTTYGDEDELRALVDACHARGMRVILDILLHGVIDQEVMAATAERVRGGPFAARLAETTTDVWGSGQDSLDARDIAWSRHILDFEPYWSAGSPSRHPLADQHPEWFMRDSAQRIIGVYTKAFDVANRAWQEYFCAAAEDLVRRLDVDGFRFDAPTYNALPNWSEATSRRASHSPLGCLELFHLLRRRLKRVKESVMLYTEPSGVLFHQSMDVTYNYDEQRLIPAVLRPRTDAAADIGVRNGRELAGWLRDRDAVLPRGAVIAPHVDSHDTFWWPLPGEKWRREQYGVAATRALLAVFALSGGAYMTFVGGECDIEPEVRRVHRLRAELPEIRTGRADYDVVAADAAEVFAVARSAGGRFTLVLVNLSAEAVTASCTVAADRVGLAGGGAVLRDRWDAGDGVGGGQGAEIRMETQSEGTWTLRLPFEPYQVRVLSPPDAKMTP